MSSALTGLLVDCAPGFSLWLWAVYILFLQARVHGSYMGLRCHHACVLREWCMAHL